MSARRADDTPFVRTADMWLEIRRMQLAARDMQRRAEHVAGEQAGPHRQLPAPRDQRDRAERVYCPKHLAVLLDHYLRVALSLTGADMANIQLRDASSGALHIAASIGFSAPFLDHFAVVDQGAACARAAQRGSRVIVADVVESAHFSRASLEVMLDARARSVQSTPLLDDEGEVIGMFSTHHHHPRSIHDHELRMIDVVAQRAAETLRSFAAARLVHAL